VFSGSKDEQHDYLLCNNLPTLLWLAQSARSNFMSGIRARKRARCGIEKRRLRDIARIAGSLGPQLSGLRAVRHRSLHLLGQEAKGAEPNSTPSLREGKEVAFWLRELLQGMSLEPIVKTSGKTGLHVFVPIRRTIDFDAARHVSELVGRHLQRLHPKDITLEWSVPKRTGKIFMDYNMNVRGKTLNVAYSPEASRARPCRCP